jgi:hypothetical protein
VQGQRQSPILKDRGYDIRSMLSGHCNHIPMGAVIDEYGAIVE